MKSFEEALSIVGGVSAMAIALGVSQPVVSNWRRRGTVLKAEYCVGIERATLGRITRRDLRPDDWHLIWPELANASAAHNGEASHD